VGMWGIGLGFGEGEGRAGGEFIWGDAGSRGAGGEGRWVAAGLLLLAVGVRAGTGPAIIWRVGPCRPVGLECGPNTAYTTVPCQPGPNELRPGRAKRTGFRPCSWARAACLGIRGGQPPA